MLQLYLAHSSAKELTVRIHQLNNLSKCPKKAHTRLFQGPDQLTPTPQQQQPTPHRSTLPRPLPQHSHGWTGKRRLRALSSVGTKNVVNLLPELEYQIGVGCQGAPTQNIIRRLHLSQQIFSKREGKKPQVWKGSTAKH